MNAQNEFSHFHESANCCEYMWVGEREMRNAHHGDACWRFGNIIFSCWSGILLRVCRHDRLEETFVCWHMWSFRWNSWGWRVEGIKLAEQLNFSCIISDEHNSTESRSDFKFQSKLNDFLEFHPSSSAFQSCSAPNRRQIVNSDNNWSTKTIN